MLADPLAEYTFGNGVSLFHPSPPQSTVERAATAVHELGHRFITTASTFGVFQYTLGALESNQRVPPELREFYRKALEETTKVSARIHEGVSGVYETLYKQSHSVGEDRYRLQGVSQFQNECMLPLIALLEPVGMPAQLGPAVLCAVVRTVLGTTIISDFLNHQEFMDTDLDLYFQNEERIPDVRFRILAENAAHGDLSKRIVSRMVNGSNRTLGASHLKDLAQSLSQLPTAAARRRHLTVIAARVSEVLRQDMRFPIVETATVGESLRIFASNWSDALRQHRVSVKAPKATLLTAEGELPDSFLREIDYAPARNRRLMLEFGRRVASSRIDDFWTILRKHSSSMYVHFRVEEEEYGGECQPARASNATSPMRAYIQRCVIFHGKRGFRCPILHYDPNDKTVPATIEFPATDLGKFMAKITTFSHVCTMTETTYLRCRRGEIRAEMGSMKLPLIVIPMTSRLSNWLRIINRHKDDGALGLIHTREMDPSDDDMDYCLFVVSQGRVIYARPTLYQVYERILAHARRLRVTQLQSFDELASLGPPDWMERLRWACQHYYHFGY